MERLSCTHQPTLRHLLATEAMGEAQLVWGEEYLDRPVVQVVMQLDPAPAPGSLVLVSRDTPEVLDDLLLSSSIKGIAGLTLITLPESEKKVQAQAEAGANISKQVSEKAVATRMLKKTSDADPLVARLLSRCKETGVPLILMPGFGDPVQMMEDVRLAFLKETKTALARIQSILMNTVLQEGLEGVVDQLHSWLSRPVAIETADFKMLASRGMGATAARQQKELTDEALSTLKSLKDEGGEALYDSFLYPVRLGRRLTLPLLYAGNTIAGYISVMVRPSDNEDSLIWFLQPAALASLVDIIHKLKGDFGLSVAQKSMLADLMTGRSLSSTDIERIERHFGFDFSDGFFVFAVQVQLQSQGNDDDAVVDVKFPEDDGLISVDVEGTRVYILPFTTDEAGTWQDEARSIASLIKENNGPCRVQIGAGRQIASVMDMRRAYREARQAMVIGSMIHKSGEFELNYADLGAKRLVYLIIDDPEVERFYKETLAPLEAYDEEWETELLDSLRVYLREGANLNSTARALFIHRHTLRYRLEQIADILNVDIDSQEVLLNLNIAFLIREMKGEE